jgi:membrane-associated phospholipid phosphatase
MNIGIKDVLYKIRWFFIPYLVVLTACLLIKLNYSREEIFFAVNSHNFAFGDIIAPYLTDLGNGWTTIALAATLLLFNYARAFIMAVVYAITSITAQIIKHIFDAPRPKLYFKDQLSQIHFVKGVDILTAFSTTLLITYWCRNKGWGLPLLLLAMMVGYSRMYLSEHFFEDVTAGSTIGVVITICLITLLMNVKFLQSAGWNRGLLKK